MRTGRSLTVWWGGVSLPGGVSPCRGVVLPAGGFYLLGGSPCWGGLPAGGFSLPGGVSLAGGFSLLETPCEQNDKQVWKYYLGHNFVATGKNGGPSKEVLLHLEINMDHSDKIQRTENILPLRINIILIISKWSSWSLSNKKYHSLCLWN